MGTYGSEETWLFGCLQEKQFCQYYYGIIVGASQERSVDREESFGDLVAEARLCSAEEFA